MKAARTNFFWMQVQSVAICVFLMVAIYAVSGLYFGQAARHLVVRSILMSVIYMPVITLAALFASEFMTRRMSGAFNGLVPVSWGWTDWVYSGGAALWVIAVLASEANPSFLAGIVMLVGRVGLSIGEAISAWRHRYDDSRV